MWLFDSCDHQWECIGKTVAQPIDIIKLAETGVSIDWNGDFEAASQGMTRFLLTCQLCGELNVKELPGVLVEEGKPP